MKKLLKELFMIEKKPRKGLMTFEWVVMAYLVLTLLYILFMYTKLPHADEMIWGRIRVVAITAALWLVYRIIPCRFTVVVRVITQMGLLGWWYPDTYELNRILPNLDHVFAGWEQQLFGCQPALIFHEKMPSVIVSELLDLGYASYYPLIALVLFYFFFFKYADFERAVFITISAFFIYYIIYILVPVTGPTFYYKAVGIKNIAAGVFPNLHDYFNFHRDCLPSPGYTDGVFYHLVEDAKAAGERPTAAFPSSHVGITIILLWLTLYVRNYRLFWVLLPFFILLTISTVYIQAHYLVDAIAGLISGTVIYLVLFLVSRNIPHRKDKRK